MQSVIYQWNGQEFVVFQNVATRGASKLKFFKIGNESFLAIVNVDNVGQETVDLFTSEGTTRLISFRRYPIPWKVWRGRVICD